MCAQHYNAHDTASLQAYLQGKTRIIDSVLQSLWNIPTVPEKLAKAMQYSLEAGGKRIRPVLCLTAATACGLDERLVLPFAAGLEFIHTYSLVHDDLPCMDNDDMRRGKPSSHVAHGEALALLAGDALLTDAFGLMARTQVPADRVLAAISLVAGSAGSAGMVGGQVLDMEYTALTTIDTQQLATMQSMKTGVMLATACQAGTLLAGANPEQQASLAAYGKSIGVAFQIMDDILDVTEDSATLGKPAGSDTKNQKVTWPSLIGLEESKHLAHTQVAMGIEALEKARFPDAFAVTKLCHLAQYLVERTN